jgi:hypothetical protein
MIDLKILQAVCASGSPSDVVPVSRKWLDKVRREIERCRLNAAADPQAATSHD